MRWHPVTSSTHCVEKSRIWTSDWLRQPGTVHHVTRVRQSTQATLAFSVRDAQSATRTALWDRLSHWRHWFRTRQASAPLSQLFPVNITSATGCTARLDVPLGRLLTGRRGTSWRAMSRLPCTRSPHILQPCRLCRYKFSRMPLLHQKSGATIGYILTLRVIVTNIRSFISLATKHNFFDDWDCFPAIWSSIRKSLSLS